MPPPPTPAPTLPVLERRAEIEALIAAHQVVVLSGQTGSGKTTQLPQICLDMSLAGPRGLIGHTQPRRLAARAVAARIAEERAVRLGGPVGVKVRFQDQTSRETRIKVMTDGVLLAELAGDPDLKAYSTLIIDEAHERSLNIDFLLGYLRTLLPRRPDLKLIVTSATIDPQRFSSAFGGPSKAPVIEVSGRMYPVEVVYAPPPGADDSDPVSADAVADAVEELARPSRPEGDVLVFLPGEREIRQADALLRRRLGPGEAEVLPLYSRLSNQEQDRIFHPSGRRRVILATNVAETSLTVPGIRYVVDTGLARLNRYDPQRKIQRLPIEPISRASADQRAGRCGRVAAGVCVRLYSEDSYRARPAFTDPEIRRTNLAGAILQMKALRLGAVERFPFIEPPDAAAVRDGYETLFELGAIACAEPDAPLTPVGEAMSRVPADPRIARMMLAAQGEGAVDEVVTLAAALSIQDPRERPMGRQEEADRAQAVFRHEASDFLTLLKLWDQYEHASRELTSGPLAGWCRERFVSPARMREWQEMIHQLRRVAEEIGLAPARASATADGVHRALLTGLITNVACREGDGSFDYRGVRGNVVQIFPGSVLFKKGPKWIMAAEVVQTTRLYARTVARVDPAWIEELAGHMFRRQLSDPHVDAETGVPSVWERVSMSGIVVVPRRRAPLTPLDPAQARAVFIREALVRARWTADLPFLAHNRRVMAEASAVESKLRRKGVLADEDALAAWFDARLPAPVHDPATVTAWLGQSDPVRDAPLRLTLADVLKPEARAALDPALYPEAIDLDTPEGPVRCPLTYALAPGKDDDGVTIDVPLAALPHFPAARAEWLVPGLLPDLITGLIKALPKPQRAALDAHAAPADLAAACAGVLTFGAGALPAALSEALDVLYGVGIDPALWSFKGLPAHLRLRVRAFDDRGAPAGADRDLPALLARLEPRIRKARAALARTAFERDAVTAWDFGDLPGPVTIEHEGAPGGTLELFPAVVDRGRSVSLMLLSSEREAAANTTLGLRRLFALACMDELEHHLAALPQWSETARWYAQLGTPEDLKRDLAAVVAGRVFMDAQPAVRTKADFDARLAAGWGRLSTVARETGEAVARILEPRSRVAHRLSGGTPRLWASSIADIREHAAYLMPRGFLAVLPWERLRHYPRYAEAMRARLFALREEGSKAETAALAAMAPHWKRFTGWVAAAMAEERAAGEAADKPGASPTARTKAPLPPARRAAPSVNLDAGEWALQPGRLPALIETYRWALEDLRVTLFAPHLAPKPPISPADLEALWRKATPPA